MLANFKNTLAGLLLVGLFVVPARAIEGQEADAKQADEAIADSEKDAAEEAANAAIKAIRPLFDRLVNAKSTRVTIELTEDTVVDGAVVNSKKSTYQIATTKPDQFTIYFKSDSQRTRIYCDGTTAAVALAESAYTLLDKPITLQKALLELPIAMGPYPEAALALSLAGVDPATTLTDGVKSVTLVGETTFRGRTPAIRFSGVQEDDVTWDLWVSRDEVPIPLRLKVNLTEMLRANGSLEMPPGYQYTLRFDYSVWRIDHPNDVALYQFKAFDGAKQYESIQAYARDQKK